MQLLYSTSSPYARKARVVLREKDLADRTDEIECNPFADPPALLARNRLGKVPTLVLDDDTALYDSPVICEYLDSVGSGPALIPASGAPRWNALRLHALADGVLDLAVALTLEGRRPEGERSPTTMERWRSRIHAALDAMGDELDTPGETIALGHLGCAVALGYLDFRHDALAWRAGRAPLADWYAEISRRRSLGETVPTDASYGR